MHLSYLWLDYDLLWVDHLLRRSQHKRWTRISELCRLLLTLLFLRAGSLLWLWRLTELFRLFLSWSLRLSDIGVRVVIDQLPPWVLRSRETLVRVRDFHPTLPLRSVRTFQICFRESLFLISSFVILNAIRCFIVHVLWTLESCATVKWHLCLNPQLGLQFWLYRLVGALTSSVITHDTFIILLNNSLLQLVWIQISWKDRWLEFQRVDVDLWLVCCCLCFQINMMVPRLEIFPNIRFRWFPFSETLLLRVLSCLDLCEISRSDGASVATFAL